MTPQEKAAEMVKQYGRDTALIVIDELLKREQQWIEKLAAEHPDDWSLEDFKKSQKMFGETRLYIFYLPPSEWSKEYSGRTAEPLEALKNIVEDWDSRTNGMDKEQLKTNPQGHEYWSPAASLISSKHIAHAREVIKKHTL